MCLKAPTNCLKTLTNTKCIKYIWNCVWKSNKNDNKCVSCRRWECEEKKFSIFSLYLLHWFSLCRGLRIVLLCSVGWLAGWQSMVFSDDDDDARSRSKWLSLIAQKIWGKCGLQLTTRRRSITMLHINVFIFKLIRHTFMYIPHPFFRSIKPSAQVEELCETSW